MSLGLVVQFTLGLSGTFELFYEATMGIGWLAYEGLSLFFSLAWCIVAYYWFLVSRFLFEGTGSRKLCDCCVMCGTCIASGS